MTRLFHKYFKSNAQFIVFVLVGFTFGLYYWHSYAKLRCSAIFSRAETSTTDRFFYDHFSYRTGSACRNGTSPIFLTISILSSFERLKLYLPAILETWLLTTDREVEVILFLEENSTTREDWIKSFFSELNRNQPTQACFYIVKLKHVENDYPPQKKSFFAMKYLHTFYRQRTQWLLRLDDNAYVHVEELVHWLKSIDHRRTLYLGQCGFGRKTGPAIQFPPGKCFCMGGGGVILSQRTLTELGPWLDQCLANETQTKHEDVELGRCILNHIHIGCSSAYDAKHFFYHHYGSGYTFGIDFTPSIVSRALILHPIRDRKTFDQLFRFRIGQKQRRLMTNFTVKSEEIFTTFSSNGELDLVRDVHYQLLDVRWRSYITDVVRTYVDQSRLASERHSSNWTVTSGKFLFGYHRQIGLHGLETIVDVLLTAQSALVSARLLAVAHKRIHVRQPFKNPARLYYREITAIHRNDPASQLNLIVVSSNKDEALGRFMDNFQREALKFSPHCDRFTLTILYFTKKNQSATPVLSRINHLAKKYPLSVRLSLMDQKTKPYNRGLGRHLAAKLFTEDRLLFFLDVDLIFTGQALENTRRSMIHQLSISSCTVYFPIVFSMFPTSDLNNGSSVTALHSLNGLFSIYGFGNVAVRKIDLDRIGGWETDNGDWGDEDVNLFKRFTETAPDCRVFRAVEPGLRHWYHKKMCYGIANKAREQMCHDAEANIFASQADMVNYVFSKKILSHSNQAR